MEKLNKILWLSLLILPVCTLGWCAQLEGNKPAVIANGAWNNGPIVDEKYLNKVVFNKVINVNFAAGLSNAVNQAIDEFRKIHPQAKFVRQSGGTLFLVNKIIESNQKTDLILVTDTQALKRLVPKYANWYIQFGQDRIVLAYSNKSKYSKEINSKNWYRILARKDVRYGYADPNLSAVGYHTFLTWQLADLYYKTKINKQSIYDFLKGSSSLENILPDAQEVLKQLESFSLDYVFVYESGAKGHNLKYVQLPKEIDLGSLEFAEFYKKAKVDVFFKNQDEKEAISGSLITFGLTIPQNAANPKGAIEFVKFFLGSSGQEILRSNYQAIADLPVTDNFNNLPVELSASVTSKAISSK